MRSSPFITLAFAALLGACAATPPSGTAASPAPAADGKSAATTGGDQRCTREFPTGSNMPVTVCRTAEERERDRRAAEGVMDTVTRSSLPGGSPGK